MTSGKSCQNQKKTEIAAKRRKKLNYADLLVDNRLIVELKTAKAFADEHVAQVLGYLRASRIKHGLLINFGAAKFEIKKFALSQSGKSEGLGGLVAGLLAFFATFAPFRG